jgi:diguanylate cyclase (GGDEF)-like protein
MHAYKIIIFDTHLTIHKEIIHRLLNQKYQHENSIAKIPKFEVDRVLKVSEGVNRIKMGLKKESPYSLAFIVINSLEDKHLEITQKIWEIDRYMQIIICIANSHEASAEALASADGNDNLLVLKNPLDNVAIRQLVCAISKKSILTRDSNFYREKINQLVEERTARSHHAIKLEFQATHDSLTELPNRILLHDRINQAILSSNRQQNQFALLFFDLDHFKLVNDSLTHQIGDELLKTVAKRLIKTMRAEDTVARFGGDEFVMIVSSLRGTDGAVSVAHKVLRAFEQPFKIQGKTINLSTSIGISIYPQDGKNAKELLRNADLAMYYAKKRGGEQFRFYTHTLDQKSQLQLNYTVELKNALDRGEFYLLYQPQFNVRQKKLLSAEALIRWLHPEKAVILPMDFIPEAESSGLIVPIGDWVIHEACKQHLAWRAIGLPPIRIAINISFQQLRQYNFTTNLRHILQEYRIKPEFIELEITEHMLLLHQDAAYAIQELKDLGVRVVLDDFGTEHSSLNYLRKLNIDALKIAPSFVSNISVNKSDEVVIKAIIAMAKNLGFEVIAQGVENAAQMKFLRKQLCDGLQGYHFSEPLAAEKIPKTLQQV